MRNLNPKFSIEFIRKHVLTSLFECRDPWNGSPTSEPFCFCSASVVRAPSARDPGPGWDSTTFGFVRITTILGCPISAFFRQRWDSTTFACEDYTILGCPILAFFWLGWDSTKYATQPSSSVSPPLSSQLVCVPLHPWFALLFVQPSCAPRFHDDWPPGAPVERVPS